MKCPFRNFRAGVPLQKCLFFFFGLEERFFFMFIFFLLLQLFFNPLAHLADGKSPGFLLKHLRNGKSRSVSDHDLRMFRQDHVFCGKVQTFREYFHQCGLECHRSSLESHWFFNIQSLGKTSDGLLRDRVKRRQSNVLFGNSLIQKRLDIRFCIHSAASGNVIDTGSSAGKIIELFHRHPEQRRDLVNEGSGSAGTASVHPHIRNGQVAGIGIFAEKDHFRVLSSQLNGCPDIGIIVF